MGCTKPDESKPWDFIRVIKTPKAQHLSEGFVSKTGSDPSLPQGSVRDGQVAFQLVEQCSKPTRGYTKVVPWYGIFQPGFYWWT